MDALKKNMPDGGEALKPFKAPNRMACTIMIGVSRGDK
jgi:hypothetical protein